MHAASRATVHPRVATCMQRYLPHSRSHAKTEGGGCWLSTGPWRGSELSWPNSVGSRPNSLAFAPPLLPYTTFPPNPEPQLLRRGKTNSALTRATHVWQYASLYPGAPGARTEPQQNGRGVGGRGCMSQGDKSGGSAAPADIRETAGSPGDGDRGRLWVGWVGCAAAP